MVVVEMALSIRAVRDLESNWISTTILYLLLIVKEIKIVER